VGCPPTPFGTKGYLGSCVRGPGRRPGTGSKKGPFPLSPTHPTLFDEKSGEAAVCCATAWVMGAAMTASRTLPASKFSLATNEDMLASPCWLWLRLRCRPADGLRLRKTHAIQKRYTLRIHVGRATNASGFAALNP